MYEEDIFPDIQFSQGLLLYLDLCSEILRNFIQTTFNYKYFRIGLIRSLICIHNTENLQGNNQNSLTLKVSTILWNLDAIMSLERSSQICCKQS